MPLALAFLAALLALFAVLPVPTFAGDLWPWSSQNAPSPPKIQPYELPTFAGAGRDYRDPNPEWVKPPRIDGDSIFRAVVACYPARTRWPIDINLEVDLHNNRVVDVTGSAIGRSIVRAVAKMPIYSDTEIDRERTREYQRRADTAKTVADFVREVAKRNAAVRALALVATMEQRSQLRVREGIADTDEQVKWLDRLIQAESDLMKSESAIQEARLKLVAQCRDDAADRLNEYLSSLAQLPAAAIVGTSGTAGKR